MFGILLIQDFVRFFRYENACFFESSPEYGLQYVVGGSSIQIGQTRTFTIAPTQAGLVYASVEQCIVSDSTNSYQLMRGNR